jgi:subtilase family serine protease
MNHSLRSVFHALLAGSALASGALISPALAGPLWHRFDPAAAVAAAPERSVQFDVVLPLRNKDALKGLLERQQIRGSADYHKWLTPAQFGAQFGPDPALAAAAAHELAGYGFSVTRGTRTLHVTGTAAMVAKAFGAELSLARGSDQHMHLVALHGLKLTPAVAAAGGRVLAFANRDLPLHVMSHAVAVGPQPANRNGSDGSYWYDDLKQAYGYPAVNATATVGGVAKPLNGSGVTISTVIDSDILDSDIRAVFEHEGYLKHASPPFPSVTHEYLGGAEPGLITGDVYEASLDTQQETGGATGAKVILYDIPDLSDASIASAYFAIDDLNETDVVSSSFGLCELYYTPAYNDGIDYTYILQTYDEAFEQGAAEGISYLASSGDGAGRECLSISYFTGGPKALYVPGPSSPATDPYVTAVGGTNLQTSFSPNSLNSTYVSENAWVDPLPPDDPYGAGILAGDHYWGADGGPSAYFTKPSYQTVHTVSTMRSTPDVGMQVGGCPSGAYFPCNGGNLAINGNGNGDRSSVIVSVFGTLYGFIGTSVSSPEFATVAALLVELQGRQGNLNPYLYATASAQLAGQLASPALHTQIPGWNSVHPNSFPAVDYNYTTGVGTPYVAALVGLPASTPLAGRPQTMSNP